MVLVRQARAAAKVAERDASSRGKVGADLKLKPKILILTRSFLPGYKGGGPLRTLANMVEQLSEELDFRIITSDRDFGDIAPYPDLTVGDWNQAGMAKVFYASPGDWSLRRLARLIRETPHDVLYLNSYFDPVASVLPLLARRCGLIPRVPTVLAPRGEFSKWSLAFKRWKKKPYRLVARAAGLHRDLLWQASSEYEAADIQRTIGACAHRIFIAPDLPSCSGAASGGEPVTRRVPGDPLRICFVSRISPQKNLDFALRVLGKVQCPVVFDIYGSLEDRTHWEKCQALVTEMEAPVIVRYHGSVEHDRVHDVFRSHDLFLFPTHGENYGHVILESMLAGTPVLIADTTPWRELEALGVGFDLSLEDPDAFVAAIQKMSAMDTAEYARWRDRVRLYALERCSDASVVMANKRLFLNALEIDT